MSKLRPTDTNNEFPRMRFRQSGFICALLMMVVTLSTAVAPAHAQQNGLPANWREDKALIEYATKRTTERIMEGCSLLVEHQFDIEKLPKDSEWSTCAMMLQMVRTMSATFQPLDSPVTGMTLCLPENADVLKIADQAAKLFQAGPKVVGDMDSTKIMIIAAGMVYPCEKSMQTTPQAIKTPAGG